MSKILIGNCLDKNSLVPLKVGLTLSKSLNREALVLHADKLADYETLDSVFAHLNLEVHKSYIQNILEANNLALEKQLKSIGVDLSNVSFESKSGSPAEVLLAEAESDSTELVVLGHDFNKGIIDFFLGSVTGSIAHKCSKPVLIAKDEKCGAPKKIAVAYDFSYHCEKALDWAVKLAKLNDAEVELVNVLPCYYQGYHVAHSLSNNFNEALEEMIQESLKKIEAKLKVKEDEVSALGVKTKSTVLLDKDGSVPDKIIEYLNANNFDLVTMGTHGRGKIAELFLGSVANRIIKKSKASVLVSK
jgi:nucleotide-binding universal stress UspA family protein